MITIQRCRIVKIKPMVTNLECGVLHEGIDLEWDGEFLGRISWPNQFIAV